VVLLVVKVPSYLPTYLFSYEQHHEEEVWLLHSWHLQEEEEGEEEERLYSYSLIITFECTQIMYLMKPKPEKKILS
jgi:hypothetical protein